MDDLLSEALSRRNVVEFDTALLPTHRADVLVVGAGIAGLVAALLAARGGLSVALVTKGQVGESATWLAQGGIAGAVGETDSAELHLADTLVAGDGLCDEDIVRAVVGEAAEALDGLTAAGVRFDVTPTGAVDLHLEGGHSLPRVLHTGDATGATVQATLGQLVRGTPQVEIYEGRFLAELLTEGDSVAGVLSFGPDDGLEVFLADSVVLATGGGGQVFRVTTNPLVATGDGLAAAWRAGAHVADLEFVQFHPTALDSASSPKFLITEALRGEGAYLLDSDEHRFMSDVHPLAELAPRDIVSRAIQREMERRHRPNVWLDARHIGQERLRARFPKVYEGCAEAGYDLANDLIPVAPAAHYMIGGVRADADGRTSLRGLFAAGEVACTGLHGANRLASNSLLEGLVGSRRLVRALIADGGVGISGEPRFVSADEPRPPALKAVARREELQWLMSRYVGVLRDAEGLATAADALGEMAGVLHVRAADRNEVELGNLVTLANLVNAGACYRHESRGTHYREDFPSRDDAGWRVHVVWRRDGDPGREDVHVGGGSAPIAGTATDPTAPAREPTL
jgi:L-aspartate oxidase